jgi:hypothetical protein
VAQPAARQRLSDRLPRRADGQGPRGPLGALARVLPRDRRRGRRRARGARHLVAGNRGREVLAGGPQRSPPPRRQRRPDLLRRRPHRVPRGDRGRLPPSMGADLHRPPDPVEHALRHLQRPQSRRCRPAARLRRRQHRGRRGRAHRLQRAMGQHVPDDRRVVAGTLDLHHPVPRAARRPAQSGLHHEQHREPQPPDPQDDQDPRPLPRRAVRHQTDLPRHYRAETKWRKAYNWAGALRGLKIHFADRLPD